MKTAASMNEFEIEALPDFNAFYRLFIGR